VSRPLLDADQLERLAEALGGDQAAMMLVAVVLGPRWSECAGLTVGDLDFLRGEVSLMHQIDAKGKLVSPKTKAAKRTMSAPAWLMEELAHVLAGRRLTAADQSALVFVSPAGAPLRYSNWRRRVWLPVIAAAGMPGLQFHSLRSNAATVLVDEGVNVKVAQVRLGHTDVRTTLEIYARATTKADRAAAELVGERFRPRKGAMESGSKNRGSGKVPRDGRGMVPIPNPDRSGQHSLNTSNFREPESGIEPLTCALRELNSRSGACPTDLNGQVTSLLRPSATSGDSLRPRTGRGLNVW
jgi:hypothetical protein